MILNRIIIIIFVVSLLSSNLLWAGEGQLDNFIDSSTQLNLALNIDTEIDADNNVLHHVEDEHHDGHDCHMSAHLLGLNSCSLTISAVHLSQLIPTFDSRFSTRQSPPPNKPPRS